MPAVSIIVPVYNAEDRIEKCIQSVQRQTLKEIEILAINDGSTDGSYKILKKLAGTDTRIKVFDFPNGGAALARNRGLLIASGDYVTFVDADDWIEPNMYEDMLATIQNDDTPLVICNIQKDYNGISQKVLEIRIHEIIREEILKKFIMMEFDYALYNKLYKREIILNYNIFFDNNLRISQDVMFNLYVFSCIKSISTIPGAFYHYVAKEGSLMSSPQDKRIASFNYIINSFRKFCSENNKPEAWQCFEKYIGPGYQRYLFNLVLTSNQTKTMRFKPYYEYLLRHLRLMDPLLLDAPLEQESTYQKFRKGLLQKKQFKIFSLLTALRHKTFKP
jgi:glycosyltransferase involved in cell wall biosynthesis